MDPSVVVQAFLFAIFGALTSAIAAVIGPTYDNLLVPELNAGSLYPAFGPTGAAPGSFLSTASSFSAYVLGNVVDPAVVLVAVAIALLYLARAAVGRAALSFDALVTKLVFSVLLANFTLPVAAALLDLGGAAYPIFAGFDGGAWQHWVNLAGYGELGFSWDNGALAFALSFALFAVVLLLAIMVALRDALLAVLLVLLPIFTLLYPIPTLAPLARRAWLMFGELVFLPCLLVIPLELAVGSPSVLLLLAYLAVALSMPSLISLAGGALTQAGFPSAGGVLSGGVQRGLSVGSLSVGNLFRPLSTVGGRAATVGGVGRVAGTAAFPAAAPLLGAEVVGRGIAHLVRHAGPAVAQRFHRPYRFPTVQRFSEFHP